MKVRGTPCGLVILNFSSASGLVQWLLLIIEIYNCCLYSHLYILKSPSSFEHKDSYVDLTVSAKNLVLYVYYLSLLHRKLFRSRTCGVKSRRLLHLYNFSQQQR